MLFQLFVFGLLIGFSDTSIVCRGPSENSHLDFRSKFDPSSIVAFGKVTEVNETSVVFNVSCSIKGRVIDGSLEFVQPHQVTNSSQCHYLTRSKTYLIFLDSMTTMEPEIVTIYRLDDREEIEINENLPKKFLEENCQKKNHYGNSLTIFYADQTNQCKRMTITCNEKLDESIGNFYRNPLTRTKTFLGGFRNENFDETKNEISGKTGGVIGDETFRNNANRLVKVEIFVIFLFLWTSFIRM